MEKILLVDGNNITLRSAYGCAPLYDKAGYPTGCIMTTVRTVCKVADAIRPIRTLFVWDGGHSQYRKEIYPEYKVRAPLEPDDPKAHLIAEWKQQIKALKDYLPLLGVGQIQMKGCEADDLIYRIKQTLSEAGYHTVIATTDADFFQLVGDDCTFYHVAREKAYNASLVNEENEVRPDQWVDLRSITGDKSDNINGVYGVGPKKAAAILKEFGTFDLFENHCLRKPNWLQEEGKKHHRSVFEDRAVVHRNRKLMALHRLPANQINESELETLLHNGVSLTVDKDAFWKMCMRHGLNTLLEESHLWGLLTQREG